MNGKVVNERAEIIIGILVIWDPGEEMSREKKRGQKLTRWRNLQSNLHNNDKEYTIGLENLQEAVFMPGSAKKCFSLDKYKIQVRSVDLLLVLCNPVQPAS